MKQFIISFLVFAYITSTSGQNSFPTTTNSNVTLDGGYINLVKPATNDGWARGFFYRMTASSDPIWAGIGLYGSGDTKVRFYMAHGDSPWSNGLGIYVGENGYLGVGTTTFDFPLTVYKDLGVTSGERFLAGFGRALSSNVIAIGYRADGTNITGGIIRSANNYPLFLGTSSYSQNLAILDNGKVGIGTTNPSVKLNVNGSSIGYPVTSGIDQTYGTFRVSSTPTNVVLDFGVNGGTEAGGWIQSTYNSNLGTNFKLLLNPNGGNVGIGTTNPKAKLNVNGSSIGYPVTSGTDQTYGLLRVSSTPTDVVLDFGVNGGTEAGSWIQSTYNSNLGTNFKLLLNPNGGNVGIGTNSPTEKLFVNGGVSINGYNSTSSVNGFHNYLQLKDVSHAAIVYQPGTTNELMFGFHSNGNFYWGTGQNAGNNYAMFLSKSGNLKVYNSVGIGIDPDLNGYKLNVAGKVRANEVVINTDGADFVFSPDYKLRSLSEVEKHIKEKGYLPEVPSANDMQQNGVGVSEMQTLLLQKVEELTLYVIEQNKKIEAQHQEILNLKEQISK